MRVQHLRVVAMWVARIRRHADARPDANAWDADA
jgi:hypothetical protein